MQWGNEAFIMHYTYGQDLSELGAFTPGKRGFWHWDKREYESSYPPRNISLPAKCQVRVVAAASDANADLGHHTLTLT